MAVEGARRFSVDEVTDHQLQQIVAMAKTDRSAAVRLALKLATQIEDGALASFAFTDLYRGKTSWPTRLGYHVDEESEQRLRQIAERFGGNYSMAIRYAIRKAFVVMTTERQAVPQPAGD